MKINVTQEHIDKGRAAVLLHRAPCYVCPIAQALADAGFHQVSVGREEAYWWENGSETVFYIPEVVSEWITAFDNGLYVEPFTLDLGEVVDTGAEVKP